MSANSDAKDIIEIAIAASEPVELDPTKMYVVVVPDHGAHVIKPEEDSFDAPRRSKGTAVVSDVDSLKVLFDKYSEPRSEVYADDARHAFTVVFNADEGAGKTPGFGDHRLALALKATPSWLAWMAIDGKLLNQQQFAEFIEDRLIDVESPSGADMLELAQSFEASTTGEFKTAQLLDSGARTLRFEETVSARAGQSGQLEIPKQIILALQPFEGGTAFRVTARFRYRIREGKLAVGVKLERPEDVVREAFAEVVKQVSEATSAPVVKGTPPAARR